MKPELVPHVDEHDIQIGVVDRTQAYAEGLVHRGAHGILRNINGLYLIQKRSVTKASWPAHFDLSAAETVKPDETYEAAIQRGLLEELGIEDATIEPIRQSYYQEYFWKEYKIFGFVTLFLLESAGEPTFADGEVESAEWMTEDAIRHLITTTPDQCTPWLVRDWQYFLGQKQ